MTFADPDILARLETATAAELDELPFGIIGMDLDSRVVVYNRTESTMAGLSSERVLGQSFFSDVAPCMNNFMVGGRYEEPALDETIDYVLTLRMKPTPVRLRLLKSATSTRQFILVER